MIRAQALYRELRDHPDRGDVEVVLLHSRFLPEDRAAHEQRLRQLFGKETARHEGSAIAVATQVVEVGLDISAEALHTESAPASAILQRAGRCARFAHETGNVFVYQAENKFPYQDQDTVIDLSAEWLQQHSGKRIDFGQEQAWVDYAHGAYDEHMLTNVRVARSAHRQAMEGALDGDAERAGQLIRNIVSQPLTVSAKPDRLLARPFDVPLFSLHPGTVRKAAKSWLERTNCQVQRLEEVTEDDQGYVTRYRWVPVVSLDDLRGAPLLAVHPDLADYDPDEGLLLDRGGQFSVEDRMRPEEVDDGPRWHTHYTLERYEEHIELVYQEFEEQTWSELAPAAARLETVYGWPEGSVRQAAVLAVLFHDVGKLTGRNGAAPGWQMWVREWQQRIGNPVSSNYLAAHTDYDDENDVHKTVLLAMQRRPPHAMEGAVSAAPLLVRGLGTRPALAKAALFRDCPASRRISVHVRSI